MFRIMRPNIVEYHHVTNIHDVIHLSLIALLCSQSFRGSRKQVSDSHDEKERPCNRIFCFSAIHLIHNISLRAPRLLSSCQDLSEQSPREEHRAQYVLTILQTR